MSSNQSSSRPRRVHKQSMRRGNGRELGSQSVLLAGVSALALFMAVPAAVALPLGGSAPKVAAPPAAPASQGADQGKRALQRAGRALQQMRDAQALAREAAKAAVNTVPHGLAPGGLVVGSGVQLPGGGIDTNLWRGAKLPQQFEDGGRVKVGIEQTQQKAILTWDSFNISEKTDLTFDQKGNRDWVALNRVMGNTGPSRILGNLKADGSVYVINQNGIIFGGASQVNVGSLIASSLDIHGGAIEYQVGAAEQQKLAARNQRFLDGILAANPNSSESVPLTFFDGTDMNTSASRVMPGETFAAYDGVTVEAGAQIAIRNLGQAVLLGHNVVNRGRIDAQDGQVLLAAGRGVLLVDGTARKLVPVPGSGDMGGAPIRGFLAGVDRGGLAENSGLIVTERGNITLTGKNVSQNGVLISTTAAETAGSIILQAESGMTNGANHTRDLYGAVQNTFPRTEQLFPFPRGERGEASFGESSYAAILPDLSDEKVVGNPYKPSTVQIYGNKITFRKDATLYVPAGDIRLIAKEKDNFAPQDGRIYLEEGATLDVSGLRDVEIAMEQNTIRAELRANELADNPVMRDSNLRGQTVYFDARYGSKLTDGTGVADLSGYYDLIERDVAQFMTVGGNISMTGMEIIVRQGSVIDLSGGSVRYLDGWVRRNRLVTAGGIAVPIELAQAGIVYVATEGGFIRHSDRWGVTEQWTLPFNRSGLRYEQGYTEGRSAGSLVLNNVISASWSGSGGNVSTDAVRIFEGEVRSDIVIGERQRVPSTGAGVTDVTRIWRERPKLATLSFGSSIGTSTTDAVWTGGNIAISGGGPRLGEDFDADTQLLDYSNQLASVYDGVEAHQHVLPSSWFDGSTFGDVTLVSGGGQNGVLTIGQGTTVDVGAFGSFTFLGRQAEIAGTIRASGGKVHLEALRSTADPGSPTPQDTWESIPEADRPSIHLGGTGVIDIAGRWTSDLAGAADAFPIFNGGKAELISRTILLDEGSLIDASGGGHLSADGTLAVGDGGSILIDTATPYTQVYQPAGLATGRLEMKGDIVAYSFGKGGSLTIDTGDDVFVGDPGPYADGVLPASTEAFRDVLLASDVVIPAGSYVPISHNAMVDYVGPGESTPVSVPVAIETGLYIPENWVVPEGWEVFDADFNQLLPGTEIAAGTTVPFVFGGFQPGEVIPAWLFPDGIHITPTPMTIPPGVWTSDVVLKAGTIIPKGAHLDQAVDIIAPVMFDVDFFTKGGFSSYALSGARGMTVTSDTVIAPTVDTMVVDIGAVQGVSGARLYDLMTQQKGVSLRNSSELPEGLRQPMELTLGTAPFNPNGVGRPRRVTGAAIGGTVTAINKARHPGKLVIETGAEIRMGAESTVRLDSLVDVFVDGTISTPSGKILIQGNGGQSGVENGSVRLGANARLLARGYQKIVPGLERNRRSVVAGGIVQIGVPADAGGGDATQGLVLIDNEAVIDVSGIKGIADLGRGGAPALEVARNPYVPVEVDGAAGSLSIYAKTGVIAGDLRLSPGGARGYGGVLTINAESLYPPFSPLTSIRVTQTTPAGFGEVTQDGPTTGYTSVAVFADVINRSGADDLFLVPATTTRSLGIVFDGDVTLATRRSITLGTAYLSTGPGASAAAGSVNITSSYVHLAGANNGDTPNPAPAGTDGRLTIRADLIDISGAARVGGFGETSFVAKGDVRLAGNRAVAGMLTTNGSFLFDAAQIYAALGRDLYLQTDPFELPENNPGFLVNAGVQIAVKSNGRPAPVPMSYGQRLTLRAPVIDQGGVIRAPQGQIRLEASQTLTLRPGSLTSASLEGLMVPFGYLDSAGLFRGYQTAGRVPTKSVKLNAPDVDMQAGSVVDVSGGGDLLGWSFVGGIGGTKNILADTSVERYAILPSLGAAPAPTSRNAARPNSGTAAPLEDSRLKIGDTVYLQGVPGLAAGYYTLLPAHYALLEGGMLVEPLGGSTAAAVKTTTQADGSVIASGYRTTLEGAVRDTGYSRFKVMNNAVWKQYSDFRTVSFNKSARELAAAAELSAVRTAADAGTIILSATRSLNLAGTGRLSASEGLLGNLDVSAAKIALVSGSTATPSDVLRLDAQQLESFGAGSVLIGGTRSIGTTGTAVTVGASELTVYKNAHFNAPEIILAASGFVDVREGASLTAEGKATVDTNSLQMSGNGALLRLSSGQRVGVVRTGGDGASGVLAIGEGAALRAAGSISFDGSNAIDLAGGIVIQAAQLDLASVIVNLGEVPDGAVGTSFTEDMLARFAAASDVLVRGHRSISLYGDFALGIRDANGVASLKALTLDTGLLQGVGADGQPSITAQSLTLRNSGAAGTYAGPDTTASLTFDVDRVQLGPGNVVLGGFETLQGSVGELRMSGTGAFNAIDVSLDVGRITAAAASDYAIVASGELQLNQGSFAGGSPEVPFGGRLALQGTSVRFGTQALLPAGVIDIRATSGDLIVADGATLDVSGRVVDFRDVVKFASGGDVRLQAAGLVSLASGSLVDVSGAARGGDAGRLDLIADSAEIGATLRGTAATGYAGGSFTLDAGQLAGSFSNLADALGAGGFDREIGVRLRSQDIVLDAGHRLEAHRVMLRSDSGWVDIRGTIAASGDTAIADGGDVRLIGEEGVKLASGARIEAQAGMASAKGFAPASGTVELASLGTRSGPADANGIDIAAGAVIDLSGGSSDGGRILMRANAAAGEDLGTVFRIAPDAVSYVGAREKVLVGVENYDVATVDAAKVSEVLAGLQAASGTTIAGFTATHGAMLRNSTGDLSIDAAIDLGANLGRSGWIGFEASGDILVNATVSDGFESARKDAALKSSAPSFNLSFDSGRDIIIGTDAIIRTGTGEIRMNAGRDIELKSNTSVIYTAGTKTPTAAGFVTGSKLGDHPTSGGDIVLTAGHDIKAPVVNQSTAAWLYHYGETNWTGDPAASTVRDQTSWSIVFANFESGVGALGGGNVRVRAGRDSKDLSVAIPTTGHLVTPTTPQDQAGPVARAEDLIVRGGGNLELETGRDLLGGVYMLGRGHAELEAGNRIAESGALAPQRTDRIYTDTTVNTLIGMMDATASLSAVGDIEIEGIYDPMLIGQVDGNLDAGQRGSAFVSYSDRTALEAVSVSGTIDYYGNSLRAADLSHGGGAYELYVLSNPPNDPRPTLPSGARLAPWAYTPNARLLPGTLRLASLQSDVSLQGKVAGVAEQILLAPSASGQLELLAENDLVFSQSIRMLDVAPQYRRGALAPFATDRNYFVNLAVGDRAPQPIGASTNWERGFVPLHADDREPMRLYALNGSIGRNPSMPATMWSVTAPKPVDIYAGKDILYGSIVAQHNTISQVSSVIAGRDIVRPEIAFLGQGMLWVEAGRDLTFLARDGVIGRGSIMSTGNVQAGNVDETGVIEFGETREDNYLPNLALSDKGGDINIIAGTKGGADYAGLDIYLDPANASDPDLPLSHPDNVGKVVRTYEKELAALLKELGYDDVPAEEQRALFSSLPKLTQQAFLQQVLFTELKETGIDYNDAVGPRFQQYTRGYAAIEKLFPASNAMPDGGWGDVMLRGGVVQSQSGGDISIMAPYGQVTVGYDAEDAKYYGRGGVVTRRGGDVRIMSDGNIDLYVSRVFTLQGGDLTMWTSNGNISAGAGAKTSVFNVPLKFTMDNDGRVSVDAFGISTGAGIGVLDAHRTSEAGSDAPPPPWAPDPVGPGEPETPEEARKQSRMDLLAFKGEINAGDAGIRVVGDFNIAALRVINAANITVTGTASGVPQVQAPDIGGLTEASSTVGAAAQAANQPQQEANQQPSIIIVEVLGFGGGDGSAPADDERDSGKTNSGQQTYNTRSAFQIVGLGALTDDQKEQLAESEKQEGQ